LERSNKNCKSKPYFNGKSMQEHQREIRKVKKKKVEYFIHIDGLEKLRSYDLYT